MHVIVLVLQMGHLRLRKVRQVLPDTSRTSSNWQWAEMGLEPEFCLTLTPPGELATRWGHLSFLLIFLLVTSDSLVSWLLTNSAFF